MMHPGAGALTAVAFVLIIGQANRFDCGKQIAAYLGLVPEEDSSGERRGWATSVNKATPCYVFCWWKRRRSRYARMRDGVKGV
jgi:transposase